MEGKSEDRNQASFIQTPHRISFHTRPSLILLFDYLIPSLPISFQSFCNFFSSFVSFSFHNKKPSKYIFLYYHNTFTKIYMSILIPNPYRYDGIYKVRIDLTSNIRKSWFSSIPSIHE